MDLELDQFKDVNLVIDKANDIFIPRQFVSQGDYKGRTLTVQITNNGSIGEVPGLTLNLNWHNEASGLTDLTAFNILDKTNSIFRIEYPDNMMTPGKVYASIQIIQDGKVTNLKQFELIVQKLAGQPVGIVEKAEFSALVAALADSNKFRTDIDKKADKTYINDYLSKVTVVPETFTNLEAIKAKYPNGANGLMVAADNGHKYIWANNVWTDAGVYQSVGIADGTVTTKKIAEEAVTIDKIDASGKTGNVLNLEDMLIGQYYGMPTIAVGQEVKLKVSAPWNGTANPIPVKEGDVVRFNKAINQEYYIGVDDNNIVRQFPPYLPTLSNSVVTVATGVTKFYATVRNEHLSTTMITINQPMPSEYVSYKAKKQLKWLSLIPGTVNQLTIDGELNAGSDNILDLKRLTPDKYVDGTAEIEVGSVASVVSNAFWNGNLTPFPVIPGDIIRFNQAVFSSYYVGVDSNNIVRQVVNHAGDTPVYKEVVVAPTVTGFYTAVRDNYLNSSMITINKPMPPKYVPHDLGKKVLEWLELSKKSVKKEHLADDLINEMGMQFSGLVANFLGDSLTKGQYLSSEAFAWPALLGEKIGLATVNNYGISGSSVSTFGSEPMVSRYQNMNDDADIVFFMGSRNDFGSSTDEFGNISTPPSDTNTFFGALKNIAEGLKNKYPGKLIIFCTPPHGSSQSIPETRPNPTTGKVYAEYIQAIRDVANHYSIPVIDFWNNAGMQPLVEIDNQTYFKHSSGTIDGVHPNKTGHERLANVAGGFIKTLVF